MYKVIFASLFILLAVTNCTDNTTDPQSTEGRLKIYLADNPALYDSVIINVVRVEIHRADGDSTSGWYTINDSTRYFDLLQLRNGATAVLGDSSLPAGKYSQIRLILGIDNYVIDNGIRHDLNVPSGTQTGLKLNHEFTIQPNILYELMLDFNVDKSILITGNGQYKLKPVIRVIPVIISGSISGRILPLDAQATVFTTVGLDTVTTFPDLNGYFKLMALPEAAYNVEIIPLNSTYQDTVIGGVNVFANQDTNIGDVQLRSN